MVPRGESCSVMPARLSEVQTEVEVRRCDLLAEVRSWRRSAVGAFAAGSAVWCCGGGTERRREGSSGEALVAQIGPQIGGNELVEGGCPCVIWGVLGCGEVEWPVKVVGRH